MDDNNRANRYYCEKCGKGFDEDWRIDKDARKKPVRFCSLKCGHIRRMSEETKKKIQSSLLKREIKYCKCGNELNYKNKSGICRVCQHNNKKSRTEIIYDFRKRRKIELVKYKGSKCEKCGYDRCIAALEFHHKDPKEKDFGISNGNIKSLEKSKKEVDKCILVCANCHREIHEKFWEVSSEVAAAVC